MMRGDIRGDVKGAKDFNVKEQWDNIKGGGRNMKEGWGLQCEGDG